MLDINCSFDWFASEEAVPGWSPAAESELSDSVMMQIHELYTSLKAWHKEVTRPSIIHQNALGTTESKESVS